MGKILYVSALQIISNHLTSEFASSKKSNSICKANLQDKLNNVIAIIVCCTPAKIMGDGQPINNIFKNVIVLFNSFCE